MSVPVIPVESDVACPEADSVCNGQCEHPSLYCSDVIWIAVAVVTFAVNVPDHVNGGSDPPVCAVNCPPACARVQMFRSATTIVMAVCGALSSGSPHRVSVKVYVPLSAGRVGPAGLAPQAIGTRLTIRTACRIIQQFVGRSEI